MVNFDFYRHNDFGAYGNEPEVNTEIESSVDSDIIPGYKLFYSIELENCRTEIEKLKQENQELRAEIVTLKNRLGDY